ncbi:MAG TPA: chemotaxis protein CheB [Planctomycetota bacterium]|nr:chemotaxis protein CheB [Planctomycetota bacterium]
MVRRTEKSARSAARAKGRGRGRPAGAGPSKGLPPGKKTFPIVGVGASAGGLKAFTRLLQSMPEDTGMAFVLIQHLNPAHESRLPHILSRSTRMPVVEVKSGTQVAPNHVYVIPPDADMSISRGTLQLTPQSEDRALHLPVDRFFHSLARERKSRALGVVLSGSGSDGSSGLAEIKAEGGITFAQDEETAQHFSMPFHAISSGSVDFVLSPEEIGQMLIQICRHPCFDPLPPRQDEEPVSPDDAVLQQIMSLLRTETRIDFSQYRQTTIRRRILHRMALLTKRGLPDYLKHLEEKRSEVEALRDGILINVTSFFRDADVFATLKKVVYPRILHAKPAVIRVWVPGCAGGEEAYSLAITLLEVLNDEPNPPIIQIFSTDISDASLAKARSGLYPPGIEAKVSSERLRRFFSREEHGYRISNSLRDLVVFAKQDVAASPPFSRLDLISCRNVLIYMGTALQQRVLSTFHFALNPDGFLLLGRSENTDAASDLFHLVDKKQKIFSKRSAAIRPILHLDRVDREISRASPRQYVDRRPTFRDDLQKAADQIVLCRYAPVGVLINDRMEVLQFRGRTGAYLEPARGAASHDLLKMARHDLALELGAAIREAKKTGILVRRENVWLGAGQENRQVHLEVVPVKLPASKEGGFLVLFFEKAEAGRPPGKSPRQSKPVPVQAPERRDRELDQLQRALSAARECLQSILEQQDAANDDLRRANEEVLASNEEIQSTNEEFQSTNEELETTVEELQSSNEEVEILNAELQNRNEQLNQLNSDLNNLLGSVKIPIVMVGLDFRIRRFNAAAAVILNIAPADIGRSIVDQEPAVSTIDVKRLLVDAFNEVTPVEEEVRDRAGRWFSLRVNPHRGSDNRVEGAILTLVDIDDVKRAQEDLHSVAQYSHAIVETVRQAILVLGPDLRVQTANRTFCKTFQVSASQTEGKLIYELGNGQWNMPGLRTLLEEVLPRHLEFRDVEVTQEFPGVGRRTMLLNAQTLRQTRATTEKILLAIQDITEDKAVKEATAVGSRRKDEFLAMLGHELRSPLAAIVHAIKLMRPLGRTDPEIEQPRAVLERQASHLTRLVDDLLDVARISSGKIHLQKEPTELGAVLLGAVETTKPVMEACNHRLEVSLPEAPVYLDGDAARLIQVFGNLLSNAAKYTEPGGHITLSSSREKDGDEVRVCVRDNGTGIPVEMLSRVFGFFTQCDSSLVNARGGLGVGLAVARSLVVLHGGTIEARSAGPGLGSEFVVTLPVLPEGKGRAARGKKDPIPASRAKRDGVRRVLVVDDHVDSAETLSTLLRLSGQDVRSAHEGLAALEIARGFEPDVVILDIGLPGLSGHEVARRLRDDAGPRPLCIVALTGFGQDDCRARALEAGFDHYMIKPVNLDALLDLLEAR